MRSNLHHFKYLRRLLRCDKGGALAELAILVPFILVMLAAVTEFGRFFQNYATLAKSTRSAARYLSNHKIDGTELGRAQNLAFCGKLDCAGSSALVDGLVTTNICIESTGSPKVTNITVRLPRTGGDCGTLGTALNGTDTSTPFVYSPIFNIGALLGTNFSMSWPLAPSTTMYYMVE